MNKTTIGLTALTVLVAGIGAYATESEANKVDSLINDLQKSEELVNELEDENVLLNEELTKLLNENKKLQEELGELKADKEEIVEGTSYVTDTSYYSETEYVSNGNCLTAAGGVFYGPSGKETYYNLDMSGVISIMRGIGNNDQYWVRSDGVKMLGDYVMVAANLNIRPRGSLVETSLGTGIVCDTGGFAAVNPTQLDIAVNW